MFFLLFFPLSVAFLGLMTYLTGELNPDNDGNYHGTDALRIGISMIVAAAVAWCCQAMIGSMQKRRRRRKIQKRKADRN